MKRVHPEDDREILNTLRTDPAKMLDVLYKKHKRTFLGFLRKIGGGSDLHIEVYHDTILAFYDIWVEGRYDASRASVSTLLCAIGKNKLLTKLGKQSREIELTELNGAIQIADDTPDETDDRITGVEHALNALGDGCRDIIVLFYYHRLNIREIGERLGYKNDNVVKAHKSRCMKRLKEIIQSTGP